MSSVPEFNFYHRQDLDPAEAAIYDNLPSVDPVREIMRQGDSGPFLGLERLIWELSLYAWSVNSDDGIALDQYLISLMSYKNPGWEAKLTAGLDQLHSQHAYEAWLADALVDTDRHADDSESRTDYLRANDFLVETHERPPQVDNLITWIAAIGDPRYWYGNPPSYIFIDSPDFPEDCPRLRRFDTAGKVQAYVSGFSNRLVVPRLDLLTSKQVGDIWDYLLIDRHIYESQFVKSDRRTSVFAEFYQQIPPETASLIDIAGGKGDFLAYLRQQGLQADFTLVDTAPKAVEFASLRGFRALHQDIGTLDLGGEQFDVATIGFSIQYLANRECLDSIYQILTPGGQVICNLYPPNSPEIMQYLELFQESGFVNLHLHYAKNGIDPILVASRPEK